MKKIICSLVAVSLLLISCSDDDGAIESPEYFGIWTLISDSSKIDPLNECELFSSVIFSETVVTTSNVIQNEEGSCIDLEDKTAPYRIEGDKIVVLTDSGEVAPTDAVVSFVVNGDRLTITTDYENDPDVVKVYIKPNSN